MRLSMLFLLCWAGALARGAEIQPRRLEEPAAAIVNPGGAGLQVILAAREVRRYVYLRTGQLLPIVTKMPDKVDAIVLDRDASLAEQQYRLRTRPANGRKVLSIMGGSDVAVLYGAYAFAEKLGVRFQLDGDVIPDARIAMALPQLDETRAPLFALRGIQPFHDFPEGPDWWNADDYKTYCAQMAKLRMNFIGLHCYPWFAEWTHVPPEPGVWIGLPEDCDGQGRVKHSYPTSWANTARSGPACPVAWGCRPAPTSAFRFGAADLFDCEAYGADVMRGLCPQPKTPEQCNDLFNRTGALFRDVFAFAGRLGIKSCVGTETPLWIPDELRARLKAAGKNPADVATIREVYEGIFRRVMKAHPVDYFWFWTPERPIDPASTQADLLCAVEAARNVRAPLKLAVCGWGWIARNFERLHQSMPKEMVFSCINEGLGHVPVTPGFVALGDRPHWAIPWLEDDTPMTVPQLWVGRVRKDAADALRYGCCGLMGIHWRTRVIGPNLSALAQAGWSQQGWSGPQRAVPPAADLAGLGGQPADYPNNSILGAGANARVYQTCRLGSLAYRLDIPDGIYDVTLMFAELHYDAPGKRVFDVKINGKTVLGKLDVFAEAGKNRALNRTFPGIAVTGGRLAIDLLPRVEAPLLAGIVVDGMAANSPDNAAYPYTRKIDCGGAGAGDFEPEIVSPSAAVRMSGCADFYADWCRAQFGDRAGPKAARIFTACDGRLPRSATWAGNGPGAVGPPDSRPWSEVERDFAFVDQFEALRADVSGAGNLERFDYWADQFRFLRAMGKVRCARGEQDRAMAALGKSNSPLPRAGEGQGVREGAAGPQPAAIDVALAARRNLVRAWTEMMTSLLQTVSTPGELGTVANLELHSRIGMNMLTRHDAALEQVLGGKLPADDAPPISYAGRPRLTVFAARTIATRGEELAIKILALDRQPMRRVELQVRALGRGPWQTVPTAHVARAIWRAQLPPAAEDFEYFIVARTEDGRALHWPPAAPGMSQTVVLAEP